MLKERPILFQTEMVQAIMEGRKTQTRREIKNQPTGDQAIDLSEIAKQSPEYFYEICKYGKPGDILWVKESFFLTEKESTASGKNIVFKAEGHHWEVDHSCKWKPSIYMPKSFARIWLQIEDITVEKLQDISRSDALAEGVKHSMSGAGFCGYDYLSKSYNLMIGPQQSFRLLWRSVKKMDRWEEMPNPFVWVIKFKVLSTTGRPQNLSVTSVVKPRKEADNA